MEKLKKAFAGVLAAATLMSAVPSTAYAADITEDSVEFVLGDANQDGKTNIVDAAFISKRLADSEADQLPEYADCNEDGIIDIRDAALISRWAVSYYATKKPFEYFLASREMVNESQGNETLSISSVEGQPGETVTLNINVECNDIFEAADYALTWDEGLEVSDIKDGSQDTAYNEKIENDSARAVAFTRNVDGSGDGSIATVEIKIPADAEAGTTYDINFSEVNNFYIVDGPDIADSVTVTGGTITVYGTPIDNPDNPDIPDNPNPPAYTGTPTLSISSAKGMPGETVTLYVDVMTNNNLESAEFYIDWDDDLEFGGFDVRKKYGWANYHTNGYVQGVVYPSSGSSSISDGTMAVIYFTIPANAAEGTTYNIDFTKVPTFDSYDGIDLTGSLITKGGTITVLEETEVITDEFDYDIVDDEYVCITSYDGSDTEIIIPSKIEGLPVKLINAYFGDDIISIEIPESVTEIASNTFFSESLESIIVSKNNNTYCSIDGVLFSKDETKLIKYPEAKKESDYVIPDSVTEIEDDAFKDCTSLANVNIPSGITVIKNDVFSGSGLTSVVIPNGVTMIGQNAFTNCQKLESVEIPASLEVIGTYLGNPEYTSKFGIVNAPWWGFDNCSSLKEINVDPANKVFSSVDGVLFNKDKTQLLLYPAGKSETKYTVPDGVTIIDGRAFEEAVNLKSIVIPEGVTSIESTAFSGCTSLANVEIPDSLTSIGMNAFSNTAITEGKTGIIYVGNWAVYSNDIKTANVKDGTIGIAKGALSNYSIETINIPASVKYIPANPNVSWGEETPLTCINVAEENEDFCSVDGVLFNRDKTRLIAYPNGKKETEYVIPDGVKTIGDSAFYGCYNLTSIKIPDSVRDIENAAFVECHYLTKVIIPDGVETIGDSAFGWCSNLGDIVFPASVKSIGELIFEYSSVKSLTVLNPECKFPNYFVDYGGFSIYGYDNSTALEYAEKYGYKYESLGKAPEITTPAVTTTTAATTTTITKATIKTTGETTDNITTSSEAATVTTAETTAVSTTNVIQIKGDADGNEIADIRDAAFIAKRVAQRRTDLLPAWADYNGDGKLNISDAAAIARDVARRTISNKPFETTPALTTLVTTAITAATTSSTESSEDDGESSLQQ